MLQLLQAWSVMQSTVFVACVLLCTLLFLSYFVSRRRKAQSHDRSHAPLRRPKTVMPPVFPNGWIPVLMSSELGPGQVKPLDVMGESLVAFRTSDGTAHVTDAYCPHLGAHLGVGGRVTGNCIECPFHGWKFDATDGVCREVPYSTAVPQFARLKVWRTTELLNTLFIWYHADGEEPSWEIQDIPEITRDGWTVRSRVSHMAYCHLQDIIENSSDMAHFNCVHSPGLLFPKENFTSYANDTQYGQLLYHRWSTSWVSEGPDAFLSANSETSIFGCCPGFLKFSLTVHLNGPAVDVIRIDNRFFRGLVLQTATPEGPLRVRLVHTLYVDPQTSRLASWIAGYGLKRMFERDMSVWQTKVYLKNPVLVKEDKTVASFRRWFSQFYSESSPTVDDVRDRTLDW